MKHLWFVTTRDRKSAERPEFCTSQFWLAVAHVEELDKMFNDEVNELVDYTTEVKSEIMSQYGGLALLTTP